MWEGLVENGSHPAVDHHSHRHLQDRGHAFFGPLFAGADGDKQNVAVLEFRIGRLVSQDQF